MSEQLDQKQIELLEETFAALAPQGEQLVEKFYEKLFSRYPQVKPLFANVDQKEQEKKLLSGLVLVINNIRKPEALGPALTSMGKRHQEYGVVAEQYPLVADTMLEVMGDLAGDLWTDDVKRAWTNALNTVATAMLEAYENSEDGTMSKTEDKSVEELTEQIAELQSKYDAVNKVQAVIEFELDGTIITANDNFLNAMGYSLEEVQGKHHSIFVEPEYAASSEYTEHWAKLNRGEHVTGEFKRINKSGEEVWINASYNPVFDADGKVYKMVKYATDGTALREERISSAKLQSAVDGAGTNLMMCDNDLNITYANPAVVEMLRARQTELRSIWPSMDVDNLIGQNIDQFHKNPAHQRALLADPSRLPAVAEINLGDVEFKVNATIVKGPNGEYLGNMVEWQDITEQNQREREVAKLQSAVDGAGTNLMMCDNDLNITYANPAVVEMLRARQTELRSIWPSMDVDNLIGQNIDQFHKNPAHQRALLADPSRLPAEAEINLGDVEFKVNATMIKGPNGEYMGNMVEWQDITEQNKRAREVARLQSAVNGAEANLMICDADLNITYANPAVIEMLRNRQTELRAIWPSLDVDNLLGENIDQFHKNPAHQRRLLGDVNNLPASAEIKVGELEFGVNATAILDNDGSYMGNMVEWRDITEQKDAERQIESLIDAAVKGELDNRLETKHYQGFMLNLATSINRMMDAVVNPMKESTRVLESLADGGLTETMEGEFNGQFSVMRDAVNTSITNLLNMVNEIRTGADSINTSANEIAQGNLNLSQRTEEQASSLEETASSIEELTGTVKQNADNAEQANQLAAGARTDAEKGGTVVSSAVKAMSEINQASKKIADIIGVIDEIAFQTNLLALNAAVEAARAGEQGRGFAVVAAEVRNLAQRSAGAAKEIKTLINDSVVKVEEGSRLVDESGSTLEEIVTSVKKVSDIIAEIAAASSEQSTGIDQINKAVAQMDEMTQQNASLVEEAASASESMDEQAKGLSELMTFFDVGEGSANNNGSSKSKERRSQDGRPWTEEKSVKGGNASAAPAKNPVKKASGGDSEWEDF